MWGMRFPWDASPLCIPMVFLHQGDQWEAQSSLSLGVYRWQGRQLRDGLPCGSLGLYFSASILYLIYRILPIEQPNIVLIISTRFILSNTKYLLKPLTG